MIKSRVLRWSRREEWTSLYKSSAEQSPHTTSSTFLALPSPKTSLRLLCPKYMCCASHLSNSMPIKTGKKSRGMSEQIIVGKTTVPTSAMTPLRAFPSPPPKYTGITHLWHTSTPLPWPGLTLHLSCGLLTAMRQRKCTETLKVIHL